MLRSARMLAVAVTASGCVLLSGCGSNDGERPAEAATAQGTAGDQANPYADLQLEKVLGTPGLCWSLDGKTARTDAGALKLERCAAKGSGEAATQTFTLTWIKSTPQGKNLYQIQNKKSGLCLHTAGSRVGQGVCTANASMLWQLSDSHFASAATGRVVTAGSEKPGTVLTLASADPSSAASQKFDIRGR